MKEEYYSIYFPNYTIGHNPYRKLGVVCTSYGNRIAIIYGKKAYAAAGSLIEDAVADAGMEITGKLWFGGDCTERNIRALLDSDAVKQADMLFAVGGGKVTDTTKAVGEMADKPVFAFPTITSNCSPCTSVSIMYHDDGSFYKPYFITRPPMHTFINLDILAAAPSKYLWAGMGDTYAKYFEAEMSSRGEELPHYVGLGVQISRMCLDPILKYGRQALEDNKEGVSSDAFEQVALDVIVTTALVSILVTKDKVIDYNTGLAHAINYGLTSYPVVEQNHLHGEIVSFGVLLLLLVDGQQEMFETMFAFSKDTGLPTRLADLGLTDADEDDVIKKAVAQKDIDHNPYPITEAMLKDAFRQLAAYRAAHITD